MSLKSSGFVRKSKAPRFIAPRMLSMSPYAETMTALIVGCCCRISMTRVRPSMFGMLMSVTTASMSGCSASFSRASVPSRAK